MTDSSPTNAESTPAARTGITSRRSLLGLGLASVIAGGAWIIGGRSGFDVIGSGGKNQELLPKVGDPAPDFVAVSLRGEPVALSDFRGTPVWLNFWGSWCPPCRAEMPDIQAAYEQLAPQGLELLAVSLGEPPEDAARFAARNNTTFTILVDPNRTLTSPAFPIYNFPTHIFIDREGIVRKIVLSIMSEKDAIANGQEILAL